MTVTASEQLERRYALQLTEDWRSWFDEDAPRLVMTGQFHLPIDWEELAEAAPTHIWPGFMLPDTLPLVSNDYGDWWCLRVGPRGQITEVVQWLHGGGDFLPVGKNLAEAVLWDHLQPWRSRSIGAQPAAHEYPPRTAPLAIGLEAWETLEPWLAERLSVSAQSLRSLVRAAEGGAYRSVMEAMLDRDWASCAVACELIEIALQGSLGLLADNQLAHRCGINWAPEYTSWLFDTDRIPAAARGLLREYRAEVEFYQDWPAAATWAERIVRQRPDLSWAGDIAGWAAERRGETERAIGYYFENRYASAFTDQSVRLRSHWFAERYGKFSVAQLDRLQPQLAPEQASDAYLQLLWHEPPQRLRAAIRDFWLVKAQAAMQAKDFVAAYAHYFQAGWDVGAERLSDYALILDGLCDSALRAGWLARAAVAQTHADCLRRRLPPSLRDIAS